MARRCTADSNLVTAGMGGLRDSGEGESGNRAMLPETLKSGMPIAAWFHRETDSAGPDIFFMSAPCTQQG